MTKMFNLLAMFGFVCVAANAHATTVTYDFWGSGEGNYALGHYSYDYITGVETFDNLVSGVDAVNIHSSFVLDVNQYPDSAFPEIDGFAYRNTFGAGWLRSHSIAAAGSVSDSLNTAGNYETTYQACDSSFCVGGAVLGITDQGDNSDSFSYYDSGALKSFTTSYSYNQVIATSLDLRLSQVGGHNLATYIGDLDLNGVNRIFQTNYFYTFYYDELGSALFLDSYISDFWAPLASASISVDRVQVPEPMPFVLFISGLLVVFVRCLVRK